MNTIVSKELGILLRNKGFDLPCYMYRWNQEYRNPVNSDMLHLVIETINHNQYETRVSAPTYSDIVLWLRKKHMIHIYQKFECSSNEVFNFYFIIDFMINKFLKPDIQVNEIDMNEEKTLYETIIIALNHI